MLSQKGEKGCKHLNQQVCFTGVWTHRVHVHQPSCFLSWVLHPVEAEAGVHLVGELAALQPLEGRQRGAIVPGWHKHGPGS